MKVFISWSGEPSRTIAWHLASWLSGVVQAIEPWMSDDEIGSGRRWRDEIGAALSDTDFGIVCLTPENQHAPWMMFEAGALAKHLKFARVIPLCVGMETNAVSGPLADWQARKLDHEGMKRVVADLNAVSPRQRPEQDLARLFEITWPGLKIAVNEAKAKYPNPARPHRPTTEEIEELYERVRQMERGNRRRRLLGRVSPSLSAPTDEFIEPATSGLRRTLADGE